MIMIFFNHICCHEYCIITYGLIDSLHAEVFYQCLARAPPSTVRLKTNKTYDEIDSATPVTLYVCCQVCG